MKLFLNRSESVALRRCLSMLQVSRSGFALSLLLGVTALGAAIALGGTAAWLIARASQQPPVLYLTVAATSVRLFGVSRALARYLSRLASHKVALTGMDNLRNNLYDELAAAPGTKLSTLRRGDLMTRAGADVDEVGNVVVKTLLPALVAAIVGVGTVGVITIISPAAGVILALSLVVSGIIAPALIARSVRLAESQGADARTDIAATSLAILEGATELSMAGTLERARHSLDRAEGELSAALARSSRLSAFARGLDVCAMGVAVIGALLIGIPQTTSGALAQVLLAVIVLVPLSSFEGVAELTPAAAQLVRSAQAAHLLTPGRGGPRTAPRCSGRPHRHRGARSRHRLAEWPHPCDWYFADTAPRIVPCDCRPLGHRQDDTAGDPHGYHPAQVGQCSHQRCSHVGSRS